VKCGALLPAEAFEAAKGTCPDCRSTLVARRAGVVGYAECARCGGLFLTREAFDAVAKDAGARASVRAAEPEVASREASLSAKFHYRLCPVCRTMMARTNYSGGSGIMVDSCRRHGVWFDHGELTAIVEFIESGGAERIRKRDALRMEEEVAALEARKRTAAGEGFPAMAASREQEEKGILEKVIDILWNLFG
jgi:Zn-finger nucleic acid-binding protein